MRKIKKSRKGLSPVIATVLLIAIVIAIALIIFLWFRATIKPAITKFDKNIDLVCQEDVSFTAVYSGGSLQIQNGNTPIFNMKIRIFKIGGYETKDISDYPQWPGDGLKQSGAYSVTEAFDGADKLLLIPVLLGNSEDGETAYECNARDGIEVSLN